MPNVVGERSFVSIAFQTASPIRCWMAFDCSSGDAGSSLPSTSITLFVVMVPVWMRVHDATVTRRWTRSRAAFVEILRRSVPFRNTSTLPAPGRASIIKATAWVWIPRRLSVEF